MKAVKYIRVLAIVAFLIMLSAPGLIQLGTKLSGVEKANNQLNENRQLAAAPVLTDMIHTPKDYTARMTAYLNDHFAGRSLMIRAYHKFFRQINSRQSKAVQGTEVPWLFLGTDQKIYWQQYSGDYALSTEQIRRWNDRIATLQNTLEANNIHFITVHMPNKNRIYDEYVSPRHGPVSQVSPTLNLSFDLEFEELFRRLKPEGQLYKKTDSHWTSLGAYYAYLHIMQTLESRGVIYPIFSQSELTEKRVKDFSGDLVSYGGYDPAEYYEDFIDLSSPIWPDVNIETRLPARSDEVTQQANQSVETIIAERLNRVDPDGSELDTAGSTLVIIGDSFETQIRPYFLYSFSRTVRVHHNMGQFSIEEVTAYDPDVVIFMPVDRFAFVAAQ